MSANIRAVVFDLGKVLLDFDYGKLIARIVEDCAISERDLHQLIDQSPLLFEYETGLISSDAFFEEVRRRSCFRGDQSDFVRYFGDIFTPIPSMIALNQELRELGLQTYIFSNTNEIAIGHIRRQYPFFEDFDGHFLSYEERLMKPAPQLYQRVQDRIGIAPSEILYIDDRLENVEGAIPFGWRTILHQSAEATRRQAAQHLGREVPVA